MHDRPRTAPLVSWHRDIAPEAPQMAHIRRIDRARLQDVPAAVGRAIDRDVRLAVAIEVRRYWHVAREAPKVADVRRVARARLQDVPTAVGGAIHRDIRLPIAVVIGLDRHVAD